MKSIINNTKHQSIMGDWGSSATIGFIWAFRPLQDNALRVAYANGSSVSYSYVTNFFPTPDNQWIHIVIVYDYTNKTGKFYRNGALFDTQALTGTPVFPLTNNVKYIGSYSTGALYNLTDGSLDEVRIYNRGLSAEEIGARYNSTRGRYQ